jgi:ABC-2 type transport system permease protein
MARQQEALIGISQLLSLPMTFLSSAIMDPQLAPGWMRTAARYNPLDWAVVALLAVLMAAAATRTFEAYQRSI